MDKYLVSESVVTKALAREGMTLDDFSDTVIGMINDGVEWEVLEDSLTPEDALEWADRAYSYGEHVGLYVWTRP